jgi:hypothetical protein
LTRGNVLAREELVDALPMKDVVRVSQIVRLLQVILSVGLHQRNSVMVSVLGPIFLSGVPLPFERIAKSVIAGGSVINMPDQDPRLRHDLIVPMALAVLNQ